jgi:hypothetical protein
MIVSLQTFRDARDLVASILLQDIDDALQPMDVRLAANKMTEAVFDLLDPSLSWRR